MPRSEEEQSRLDLTLAMHREALIAMNPDAVDGDHVVVPVHVKR